MKHWQMVGCHEEGRLTQCMCCPYLLLKIRALQCGFGGYKLSTYEVNFIKAILEPIDDRNISSHCRLPSYSFPR